MTQPQKSATGSSEPPQRIVMLPSPGLRDVIVVLIGAVLGLLAGPHVLGQVQPDAYRHAFLGGLGEKRALDELRESWEHTLTELGVPLDAERRDLESWQLDRLEARDEELAPFKEAMDEAKAERKAQLQGTSRTLALAAATVLVLAGVCGGRLTRFKPRFVTAIAALLAVWLTLHLGRPDLLEPVSLPFTALVIALVIVAALLPLPSGRQ